MARKIPATVITGFLGAGKTSIIRHLLENANGRRIALIVNEFGDIGIDGEILKGCGIQGCDDEDILELANGCICCTVADDFIPTMEALLGREKKPDQIVIETSGLAMPKPLVKAFNWPDIRTRVTVDAVVTVVDGPAVAAGLFAADPEAVQAQREDDDALEHESPLEELFEEQLGCADMVVINKTDLLERDGLDTVTSRGRGTASAVGEGGDRGPRRGGPGGAAGSGCGRRRTTSTRGRPTTTEWTTMTTTTSTPSAWRWRTRRAPKS